MAKYIVASAIKHPPLMEILAFQLFAGHKELREGEQPDHASDWRNLDESDRRTWRENARKLLDNMHTSGLKGLVTDETRLAGAVDALITRPAEIAYRLPT